MHFWYFAPWASTDCRNSTKIDVWNSSNTSPNIVPRSSVLNLRTKPFVASFTKYVWIHLSILLYCYIYWTIADVKVKPSLSKGWKRKRHENEDVAKNRTSLELKYQREDIMHPPDSGHYPPRKKILPTTTATAHAHPLSSGNVQIPQNTLFDISSQPSPPIPGIISEQVENDVHIDRLTFDVEEHSSLSLTGFEHTQVVWTSDLVSDRELHKLFAETDTHQYTALSLEVNFNRNSTSIYQRSYGFTIFMHVLNEDIYGVYDILIRCEGSLWNHDLYELGLLYVSQWSSSCMVYWPDCTVCGSLLLKRFWARMCDDFSESSK